MTLRALPLVIAAIACVALGACSEDTPTACAAATGATGNCTDACKKLVELDCRIAATEEECVAACEASSVGLDPAVTGRVRACYALATSCAEVDGCSLTCGPGGGPVPFVRADGGAVDAGAVLDAGEGMDAGGSMTDAGGPGSDAGSADDAGSPGGDAGAPAVDGG